MSTQMRAALVGTAACVTSAAAMIAAATLAGGTARAPRLAPLRPRPAVGSPDLRAAATTRTELTFRVEGGRPRAVLVMPDGGARVGVVLVAGSGATNREDQLGVARQLARYGVAALTYDKRSAGYTLFHRDYAQLADDLLAAVEAMRRETGIARIGAWGMSEGAWVVSDAAARPRTPLAFAVLASAPVVTPGEQTAWAVDHLLRAAPVPIRLAAATVLGQGRFLLDYLDVDTRPSLGAIDMPVLALWGAEDAIVPVNQAYRDLVAGLDGALTALIVPELGHDLQADAAAWGPQVAAWIHEPGGTGLVGVEPASDLGVAEPPPQRWYSDPRLHAAVAAVAAALGAGAAVKRRGSGRARTNVTEGSPARAAPRWSPQEWSC